MKFYDYLMMILAIVAVLVVLIAAIRTKKPLKTLMSSAAWGLAVLILVSITGPFTGFTLQITPFTLGTSIAFGLPGVICIALTKMMWGI